MRTDVDGSAKVVKRYILFCSPSSVLRIASAEVRCEVGNHKALLNKCVGDVLRHSR